MFTSGLPMHFEGGEYIVDAYCIIIIIVVVVVVVVVVIILILLLSYFLSFAR